MKIRAIIVDDEIKSRKAISQDLDDFCPDVEVVGAADSVGSAKELIDREQPDVVFLDIQLKNQNAFQLLESFPQINFKIIFVTAYDQFAIRAFKFSAIDYLLKPIDAEELVQAVGRVNHLADSTSDELLKVLLSNNIQAQKPRKLALQTSDGLHILSVDEIIRIESEGNYSNIHFQAEASLVVSRTLKDFEDLLLDHSFLRVHQSHLINVNKVKQYVNREGGYILMDNGASIPISRRKRGEVLKSLGSI